jgi:hypothetical protein
MYFKLQEFISRCDKNSLNNLKNTLEIAKSSNQCKIIVNQKNIQQKSQRTLKMKNI